MAMDVLSLEDLAGHAWLMRRHLTLCCNKAGCFRPLFRVDSTGCPHLYYCQLHKPKINQCDSCYDVFCKECLPDGTRYCSKCLSDKSNQCRFCDKPQHGFYNGCTGDCGTFRTNLCREHTGPPNGSYLCTECGCKQCAHSTACENSPVVCCNNCREMFCWKHAQHKTYATLCRTCGTFNCGCGDGPEYPCCFSDSTHLGDHKF